MFQLSGITADDLMHVIRHIDPFMDYQPFLFYAVLRTLYKQFFILFSRKSIYPSNNTEGYKMRNSIFANFVFRGYCPLT